MALNQLAIVVGILMTYTSNWLLLGVGENSWRWMFEVEAVPALLFTIALFFIPESPRWLAKNGRDEEAKGIFERIGGGDYAQQEITLVRESLDKEVGGIRELFDSKLSLVLITGFGLAVFANLTGINVIIYYGTDIFKLAGFVEDSGSFKVQMIIGLTNLIFTFVLT